MEKRYLINGSKYSLIGARWYDYKGDEIIDPETKLELFREVKWENWRPVGADQEGSGGGGGGLTPEQQAKLNAINITGSGDGYLTNDGTYKPINSIAFTTYTNMAAFPGTGENGKLYLDASTGNLYYWDGSSYHVIDEGLFGNYVTLGTNQSITGVKTFTSNISLASGVKVGAVNPVTGINHEVLGINSYSDSNGTYAQTEEGTKDSLYNINIVYDEDRTKGHATVDVYNSDGSFKNKETLAYISDVENALIPHAKVTNQNLNSIGSTGTLTYDGITGQVQNTDGTFLSMQFTSDTEYTSVNLVRTVYATSGNSTQRLDNVALGATPVAFPPLTVGANVRVEIEVIVNDTGDIYHIVAGGPTDLTTCWGYVEKI